LDLFQSKFLESNLGQYIEDFDETLYTTPETALSFIIHKFTNIFMNKRSDLENFFVLYVSGMDKINVDEVFEHVFTKANGLHR
jgi:hypothetical protein